MNLAAYVPARFTVPQNPLWDGPGLGDFVPGRFAIPQNPVGLPTAPALTRRDISSKSNGMGCGCGASCGGCGMGEFSMDSITNLIPGETFGIPNTYLALGVVALLVLGGGATRRRR